MKINIQRKCNACKEAIEINRKNVQGVVYYKKLYYHTTCFCELAERKSYLKNGKPTEWKDALDHIEDFEKDAANAVGVNGTKAKRNTDDLNDYLLEQYNVTALPGNFWMAVTNLQKGIYRGKRCKKISIETLLEAWKWGQNELNKINRYNKASHKGPTDDNQRIAYDFAIVVRKLPNFLAHKAKQDALREEVNAKNTHINYDNIQRTETQCDGLDDISALLDEF